LLLTEYKAQCFKVYTPWMIVLCSFEQYLAQANCSLKIWICDIDCWHDLGCGNDHCLNTSSPAVVFKHQVATSSSDHVATKFR
jgi:hypothetical protein